MSFILLSSCHVRKSCDLKQINHLNKQIENNLIQKGLFNHFPKSLKGKLINAELRVPNSNEISINDSDSAKKNYSILIIKKDDDIKKYIPQYYIYKTRYIQNDYPDKYPVPNLTNYDFKLGSIERIFTNNDEQYVENIYNIPDDIEVYVIDAKSGWFWKDKSNDYKTEAMKKWEHGFSKGIAISKEKNIVVYWAMIW